MRKFLYIYLSAAIILVTASYSYYRSSSQNILHRAQLEDASLTKLEQQLLVNKIRGFSSDLITFANMHAWKKTFAPSSTKDIENLAEDLQELLATKKDYESIRLIGLQGKELLRVNFHKGGVQIVPGSEFQNKKHRYYITASESLQKNQIYLSPVDLNWEHNKPEQPLRPAMRLITPVFDAHEKKQGLLVMNVRVPLILQQIAHKYANIPSRMHLVNRQGVWLHNGLMTTTWDYLLPDQHLKQFADKFPAAWQYIHQHENGMILNKREGMFTFSTVHLLEAAYRSLPESLNNNAVSGIDKQPVWKIIAHRSDDELASLTASSGWRIGGYTLLLLLLLIPLIWRMVSHASERKRAEQQLRNSEYKFRHLVEDLPDGLVVIIDATVVYANKMVAELFGGKNALSIVGRPMIDFVHPESRQMVNHRIQHVMNGQTAEAAEEHLLAIDGTDIFALVTSTSILFDGKQAVQTVIRDITEQRRAEGALRISQQRHELYMAQTNMAVIEWDTNFTVVEWNHGAEDVFGFSADYAKGKHAIELILPPAQRQTVESNWQQLLTNQGGYHSINENITSDGRTITCEWYNTPLIRKDGEVIGVTSLCSDISEQQRQHHELRKLQQAIEHAGESFLITDAKSNIEYVNPAFSKITGYCVDEVIGKTPSILNSGRQDDVFYQRLWQKISSGHTWYGSLICKRKDGGLYPALMSVAPIIDGSGNISHYIYIQQDMSEHEKLEDKFREAQKMETLGTLVAGVAHDFNNVLAGMLGNIYLMKRQMASDIGAQQKLKSIEQAGLHAADMIKQLLAFSRKTERELTPMSVQPFIKETLKLARVSIPENITLLDDLGTQDYRIRGDGSQMRHMMLNLMINASHAVAGRDKPCITVSMHTYEPDAGFLLAHSEIENKTLLCITVADNGCGISKTNIKRVFEPFFTTKQAGIGTGLGLAMVHGSMQHHGGVINIESEEGEGTRMNLYFPLSHSSAVEDHKEKLGVLNGEGETILLADDNAHARAAMQEVLQSFGYRVLAAENGRQALLLFIDHASEIELGLLDVVMPVMGGVEAADRMRELKPNFPVLFLSGYEGDATSAEKLGVQSITVLTKPVDLVELSHHMRKTMNEYQKNI